MNSVLIDKPGMSKRSAESVRDAVDDALDAGARDGAAGGVVAADVAQYCELAPGTVRSYLRLLVEHDELAVVWGIGKGAPRRSYLPVGHPDAGGGGSYRDKRFTDGDRA